MNSNILDLKGNDVIVDDNVEWDDDDDDDDDDVDDDSDGGCKVA